MLQAIIAGTMTPALQLTGTDFASPVEAYAEKANSRLLLELKKAVQGETT